MMMMIQSAAQMGENWPGPGGGEKFAAQQGQHYDYIVITIMLMMITSMMMMMVAGQERGGRHHETDIRSELETNKQLYQVLTFILIMVFMTF